jgi:ribosomal protein L37AE/L43A
VPEEEKVKAFQAPDGTVYACPDCDEPVPDDGTNKLLTCGNCGVVFNPDAEPEAPPAEEEAPVEEPF